MARKLRTHIDNQEGRSMTSTNDNDGGNVPRAVSQMSKQEFGRNLYRLMIAKGWTQSYLAKQAGILRGSVSDYINGKTFPSPKATRKLAAALGVPETELLPNQIIGAIADDVPELGFRVSPADPTKAYLQINMLVPVQAALQVLALLQPNEAVNGR